MTRESISEMFPNEQFMYCHGFDEAIIGVDWDMRIVYEIEKMIEIQTEEFDGAYQEAVEYLEYNTFCAYIGEKTPIFVYSKLNT